MTEWQPIETAPTDKCQFLVTDWVDGDEWSGCIELVNGPFLKDGRILCQNSGNYISPNCLTYWMPLPPKPNTD